MQKIKIGKDVTSKLLLEYIKENQPCPLYYTVDKRKSSPRIIELNKKLTEYIKMVAGPSILKRINFLIKKGKIEKSWIGLHGLIYKLTKREEASLNMGQYKQELIEQMEADYIYEQEQKEEDLNEDLIKSILDEHTKNFKTIRKSEIELEKKFREDAVNKAVKETLTHSEDKYKSNLEKANSEIVRLNTEIEKLKNNLSRLSSYRDLSLKKFGAEYSKTSLASMIINEDVSELCYKQDGNGKSLHIKK